MGRRRGVEQDELSVGAQRRSRDEGFLQEDANVRDEIAAGWMVGAVEDDIVLLHDGLGVFWGEMVAMGDVSWERIKSISSSQ